MSAPRPGLLFARKRAPLQKWHFNRTKFPVGGEHAADFVDTLIQNMANLPIPAQIGQQLLAKAVKMKNVGLMGDEISDLLAPPDPNNLPPEAQAIVQQLKGRFSNLAKENQECRRPQE